MKDPAKYSFAEFTFSYTLPSWYTKDPNYITAKDKFTFIVKMKLFFKPKQYIFDKKMLTTYKILGNKVYVLHKEVE